MAEILTESYCERCGAKFTFESPAATSGPVTRARTFARGLRNYLTSDESLDDAIAEARREQDRQASGIQLRAFHDTFSFCFTCRQYTCRDCWNDSAGRCRTCVPMPDAPDPLDIKGLQAELTRLEEPAESESWVAERLEPLTVDVLSWPPVEPSGAEPTPEPTVAAVTAVEPEAGQEVSAPRETQVPVSAADLLPEAEAEPVPESEPVLTEAAAPEAGAIPPAAAFATEVEVGAAEPVGAEIEPTGPAAVQPAAQLVPAALAETVPVELPETVAATEPAGIAEPEPAMAAEEPEAEAAAWQVGPAAPKPFAPEALAPEPVAAGPEVERDAEGALEAERPAGAHAARELAFTAEPEAAAQAEPAAEALEAEPEAAAQAEPAAEAPAVEPAPEPAPAVQPTVPPAPAQVPIRQPRPPATGPAPWQVVAPDERPLPAPGRPEALPGDAAPRQMGWMLRRRDNPVPQVSPRITRSVWEESTRDLVAHTGSGIQACQGCGLPLSASARFCRRCGAQQV